MNLWIHKFNKGHTVQVTSSLNIRCTLLLYPDHLQCFTMMPFLEIKGYPQYINSYLLPFFLLLFYYMTGSSSYLMLFLELLGSVKHLLRFSPEIDAIHWWLQWPFYTYYKSMLLPFRQSIKTDKTLNAFNESCIVCSNKCQKYRIIES